MFLFWGFLSPLQNVEVECSVKSGRIVAHKNTQVFFTRQLVNKLLKASFTKERQPNSPNMKIARDDRAVKLGCSD